MPGAAGRGRVPGLTGAVCTLLAGVSLAAPGPDGEAVIRAMLDTFLANVEAVDAHEAFWADDLVYTSSAGTRTTKPEIIAGLRSQAPQAPATSYSARDVDVRVYGRMAVLAFRLVAQTGDANRTEYLNTGTLLQRDGRWQVVAWQATRIPDDAERATGQD